MTTMTRLLTCLVLVFSLSALWSSKATAQSPVFDARIVILDASGSMRRENEYPRRNGNRWDEALAISEEYFNQLEALGDTLPTEILVFGAETDFLRTLQAEQRKPSSQRRFTNSTNYPIGGALCKDMKFVTSAFATPGAATWDLLDTYVSGLSGTSPPGGMTPQGPVLNMAFERLIAEYGPGVKAQIVMFSDFDAINCAPPDQTVCAQILPSLEILRANGGSAEMRVLGIPSSDLALDLKDCVSTATDTHDPSDSVEQTVEDFIDNVSVVAAARSTTPGLLNPSNIDLRDMSFEVFASGKPLLVAGGPAQDSLPIPKAKYDFVLRSGAQEWRIAQKEVQVDQVITFAVEAGQIQLSATRGGVTVAQLDRVEIRDASKKNLLPAGGVVVAANYVLMAGQYDLTALLDGQSQTVPVTVNFGKVTPVALNFDPRAVAPRAVSVVLDIKQPTLTILPFSPQVRLSGPGTPTVALHSASSALSLAAGTYDVSVGKTRLHNLRFDVPAGSTPMEVRIVVTPGWFEAKAPVPGGSFELLSATGKRLATFTGDDLRHSIADGEYVLEHIGPDRQRRRSPLHITAGDFTQARF